MAKYHNYCGARNFTKTQAFYKKKGSNASQKKRSKKPLKPVELPEETGLPKYRKALEEYEQGKPMPTILQDFIPEKIMKALLGLKNEEENSEGEDEFWVETCHSITHIEESCNTIHYGSDSEEESLSLEELFFSRRGVRCRFGENNETRVPINSPIGGIHP